MNIVVLDGYTINPGDLSWERLEDLCERFTVFDTTPDDKAMARLEASSMLLTSHCTVTKEMMQRAPGLRYIGCMKNSYDNIDVKAAADLGIAVTNIPQYSVESTAQHTIALLMEFTNHVGMHNASVHSGQWSDSSYFCYWKEPVTLLAGRSIGIIGDEPSGARVAVVAHALGMKVNLFSQDPSGAMKSDFVSLHCPLNGENEKMVNTEFLVNMKPGAVLINTSSGRLIDERALADSIKAGFVKGAALDGLAEQPPAKDCPLIGLENCLITPYSVWSPVELRRAIIDVSADNIISWLSNGTLNRVV